MSAQHTPGGLASTAASDMHAALQAVKSNLMHQRRFGPDTFDAWRMACTQAEADIEEAIAKAAGSAS